MEENGIGHTHLPIFGKPHRAVPSTLSFAAGGAAALFDLTPPVGTDRACCAVREEYVSVLCFLCLSLPRTFRGATTTFDTTRFWPVQRATTHVRHHHL
jgi:hypothetical protein